VTKNDLHERFLVLYSTHQRQIHAMIASLVPNPSDVQELLHETTLLLWQEFENFDPAQSFVRWACGVAFNVVRAFRRKRPVCALPMDDELLARLVHDRRSLDDTLEARRVALRQCLQKLRPPDHQLIMNCYAGEEAIVTVAEKIGRPAGAVYQSLGRIRRALMTCIARTLRRQEDHGL
jgi:RNA polymerase sigma-70 factor, ECF subfamily